MKRKPKRKRLPKPLKLELDEKTVNLLRYYTMLGIESEKPQKKMIHLSSVLGEMSAIGDMVCERIQWLFVTQFPMDKFIWGAIMKQRQLPDRMPKERQFAATKYAQENGRE